MSLIHSAFALRGFLRIPKNHKVFKDDKLSESVSTRTVQSDVKQEKEFKVCPDCKALAQPAHVCGKPQRVSADGDRHKRRANQNPVAGNGASPGATGGKGQQQRKQRRVIVCFNCRREGHTELFCPGCRLCGDHGHMAAACPKRSVRCNLCHRIGHDSDHCRPRKPRVEREPKPRDLKGQSADVLKLIPPTVADAPALDDHGAIVSDLLQQEVRAPKLQLGDFMPNPIAKRQQGVIAEVDGQLLAPIAEQTVRIPQQIADYFGVQLGVPIPAEVLLRQQIPQQAEVRRLARVNPSWQPANHEAPKRQVFHGPPEPQAQRQAPVPAIRGAVGRRVGGPPPPNRPAPRMPNRPIPPPVPPVVPQMPALQGFPGPVIVAQQPPLPPPPPPPPDGGGPLGAGGGPVAPLPAVPARLAAPAPRDHWANVRAKINSMLATKDLDLKADRETIIRSAMEILRKEQVDGVDLTARVLAIYNEEHSKVLESRLNFSAARVLCRRPFEVFWNSFSCNSYDYSIKEAAICMRIPILGDVQPTDEIRRYETMITQSRPRFSFLPWLLGKISHFGCVPMFEEWLKRSKRDPGIGLARGMVQSFCREVFVPQSVNNDQLSWTFGSMVPRMWEGLLASARVFAEATRWEEGLSGTGDSVLAWWNCSFHPVEHFQSLVSGPWAMRWRFIPSVLRRCGFSTMRSWLPSFFLSVYEVGDPRKNTPIGYLLRLGPRFLAHLLLSYLPFWSSVVVHITWNIFWGLVSPPIALNCMRTREIDPEDFTVVRCGDYHSVCLADHPVKTKDIPCNGLTYRRWNYVCKPMFGVRSYFGVKGCIPTVYRGCWHNEKLSMDGRVFKELPQDASHEAYWNIVANWNVISRNHCDFLAKRIRRVARPYDFKAWAASFPPRRRDELLECKKHFEYARLIKPRAKSFIKKELAVKNTDDLVFKDPRFIQGCPLEMSVTCGPWIRKLAKKVRRRLMPKRCLPSEILEGRQIIYTCGLSCEEVGAWFGKGIDLITSMLEPGEKLVFLEDDQSRFDLHLGQGPFAFLDKMYERLLPKKVCRILKRGMETAGTTNLGTKYEVAYTMQSGWPDTSLGDTLVNVAMKMEIHGRGRKWLSIVCGDDSVTITTDWEVNRIGGHEGLVNRYTGYGMEVEAIIQGHPLDVGFCSGRFHPCNGSYVLMPKAGKLLAKLFWDIRDRSKAEQLEWLRSICSTLDAFGQVDPLLASLGVAIRSQLPSGREMVEYNEYKHQIKGKFSVPLDDVQYFYAHHYGMSARDIEECIELLSRARLGDIITDSRIVHMSRVDIA